MQNYLKITDRKQLIGLFIVGLISLCFFSLLFWLNIYTDIQGHIEQIQAMVRGEMIRGNFIYYLIVWLLAFGQTKSFALAIASIFVLTLAVMTKYQITFHYLKKDRYAVWLALALVFAFSLPGPDYFYRGQIPPNIWHNSTTIFLMPFALLLFIQCESYLKKGKWDSISRLSILIFLNVFIKPSFFFCIGIIVPLIATFTFGLQKALKDLTLPIGLGWAFVGLQYVLTYYLDPATTDGVTGAGVQIAPLLVWRANSSMVWLSLLASLAFPASVVGLRLWRRDKVAMYCNTSLRFTWALLALGILIYIFIAETGERALHGNFAWQNIVCMYMLFLVSVKESFEPILNPDRAPNPVRVKNIILTLHVISGIAYLAKILITGSYF
jgi:hypothetical protein